MNNEERNLPPDEENVVELPDDELRYAPQDALVTDDAEPDEIDVAIEASDEADETESLESADSDVPVTDGMDIEAALAAVSTLSDMLAEQEAAEQARLAQIEAEAQAAAERQARLEHPEQFFPVPPMSVLHRGQMASVVPALLLIGIGAWLTFSFTTKSPPDASIIVAVVLAAIGLTLFTRWLGSGRWTRGSLFGGLSLLFSAGLLFFLLLPGSPGLANGWPLLLVGTGIAALLTGFLAVHREKRLVFPGIALILAGVIGTVVSLGFLDDAFISTAAALWPAALVAVVLVLLVPVLFRQHS